jgi:lysyl-tRNA synthetase class 1
MQWLNNIIDELEKRHPEGEILIESGASPSGTYHLGHLRELMTADAILLELRRRGRTARHIQFVDDLDALRKIPHNVPEDFEQYLGKPLCDIPAPDGSHRSYADYFLQGLKDACQELGIDVEYVRSHEKYRSGWLVPAIERTLDRLPAVRQALETISGRQLNEQWTPIQVMEDGRLKNRTFLSVNTEDKTLEYADKDGNPQTVHYDKGEVKLDWRLDWPARWWLLSVACEPSGRDHVTKGSSVDTGVQLMKDVFEAEPPLSVAYDFINMAGDTKKMSASKGTGLDAMEAAQIMPAEVMRYFVFRAPPLKRLYFDPVNGVVQLMDEFAAFAARTDRNESEEQLLYLCTRGLDKKTVSRVPFSHLVASYQAALKDADKTLDIIRRTEHAQIVDEDADIIRNELKFIDAWLTKHAPEDVKFALKDTVDAAVFNTAQKAFMNGLADKIAAAPEDADGEWFHQAIYSFKDYEGLGPKDLFTTLYQALIGKASGPRAGWFLSILPRDWLMKRLRLEA